MTTDLIRRLSSEVGAVAAEQGSAVSLDAFRRWANDPVGFVRHYGGEPVDYQARIMESVATNKLTAVRGCHACGKEWTAGWLAVWAAACRQMLVLVVSATERQALGQTMREVRAACRAVTDLSAQLLTGSIRINGEDRIIALAGGTNVDCLTGWHDARGGVLVIISEGQGERLEDVAYDSAIANATSDACRVLAMGNPVRSSGRFFEINQKAHWNPTKVSAHDTPNVRAGSNVRAGFPSFTWPQEVVDEYGLDSPYYVARVLGEFPASDIEGLLRRSWLDAAVQKWEQEMHQPPGARNEANLVEPPVLGIDPARYGSDKSAIAYVRGGVVRELFTWSGAALTTSADKVLDYARRVQEHDIYRRRPELWVDEPGLGGGLIDTLRERGWEVAGFNGASRPRDPRRFLNRRSEAFWALRSALEGGRVALPEDKLLFEEALTVEWTISAAGCIQIGAKDLQRKTLGRSPDRLDAVVIALAASMGAYAPPLISFGHVRI